MSKRTVLLIIGLLIVTAGLLALALAPKKQDAPREEALKPAPSYAHTNLRIEAPEKSETGVNSAQVTIDTGGDDITAVQLELSFDPEKIQVDNVVPATFFEAPTELVKKIDNAGGTVSYALIAGIGKEGAKGKGDVATITFREIGTEGETAAINFEAKSLVTSSQTDQSVLNKAIGVTFTITNPRASAPAAATSPVPTQ